MAGGTKELIYGIKHASIGKLLPTQLELDCKPTRRHNKPNILRPDAPTPLFFHHKSIGFLSYQQISMIFHSSEKATKCKAVAKQRAEINLQYRGANFQKHLRSCYIHKQVGNLWILT